MFPSVYLLAVCLCSHPLTGICLFLLTKKGQPCDPVINVPYVCLGQHVTVEDSYLCGYLKIKGLTEVRFETRSNVAKLTFILSDTKYKLVLTFRPA